MGDWLPVGTTSAAAPPEITIDYAATPRGPRCGNAQRRAVSLYLASSAFTLSAWGKEYSVSRAMASTFLYELMIMCGTAASVG